VPEIRFFHFEEAQQLLADLVEATLASEGAPGGLSGGIVGPGAWLPARSLKVAVPGLAELRRALGDGGALVYVPSRYRTHLFVVDAQGLRCEVLASARDLIRAVVLMQGRLASGDASTIATAAATVRDLVLPPGCRQAMARWHTLTVSGTMV
jgi:hypothetical protein